MSAGAFKKELDLSLYTEIASNLKVGLVGTFNKGPFTRTLITNVPQLESTFGKPIDSDTYCQGFFAAREYLRRGNQLYVVRVESTANASVKAEGSIQGVSNESLDSGDDGVTSIPATREFTPAVSPTFVTIGVQIGDVLEIADVSSADDNGFYVITAVAETKVTVDRDWPTGSLNSLTYTIWTSKREEGTNGATSVPATREFTSVGATFQTNGVEAGDILYIYDGVTTDDNGYYVIDSVDSETKVTVDRNFPVGSKSSLDYTVYGYNHPDMADGDTSVDGEFSSATASFDSHGVVAGDILVIEDAVDTGDNGVYTISGLKVGSEETVLEVENATWTTGSLTNLSFRVLPGCILFSGATNGTWCTGYDVALQVNSYDGSKFDVLVYDENDFLLETIYSTDFASIATDMSSSDYLTAAVVAARAGPGLPGSCTLSGGDDGYTSIVAADYIGSSSAYGMQLFSNPEAIDIDVILCPGVSTQAVGDALISLAEDRGDCMTIVDPPFNATVDAPGEAIDWHNGTGGYGRTAAINSSYGAFYWSTLKVYDSYNAVTRELAPSAAAIGVWAQSQNASFLWFAPAGYKRGKVTGATDVYYSPSLGERTAMQTNSNSVNPIVNFETDGIVVFGQKTLLRTSSALNRINVRRMMLYLEKQALASVKNLAFDPNDEFTWREVIRLIEPLCEYIEANRGMNDFLVVCDESTNTEAVQEANKVVARIFVKPTKTAEIIELVFAVTSQSADFTELLAA